MAAPPALIISIPNFGIDKSPILGDNRAAEMINFAADVFKLIIINSVYRQLPF